MELSFLYSNYRKAGAAVFIIAALIAFSRMYLFLHFPTDVFFGIVLGILCGVAAVKICDLAAKKLQNRE